MPKLIRKLTNKEITDAKPKDKPYRLCDEGGLRLLVRPTGKKVWQIPYTFRGKANTYTAGEFNPHRKASHIGLREARDVRDEIKELVDNGIDPNKHKQAKKICSRHNQDTTFESVAREWHGKGVWAPGHAKRIIRSLEKDVFPIIGYKDISNIEAIDVTMVLSEIENRGAYDTAKRMCQRCVAIFDYAIFKGISDNNPAIGRSKFIRVPKTKHRPHLQADQIPDFLEALNNYSGRDYIKLALKLLFLTFVRPGELRCATWNEIDWENRLWRIPAERMKMKRDHVIPLSNQTISVLEKLNKITGNSDYLFPGIHNIHQPMSDVTLLKALKIMGYTNEKKITPHGFRHTASTILNEHGFNADWIERQLAHVPSNKIRGIYNKAQYLDGRTQMMQWWADYLDEARG